MTMQASADELLASDSPLEGLHDLIWTSLANGVQEASHPWCFGFFSTVALSSNDGSGPIPNTRTVILRRVQLASRSLDFHTDGRSGKVQEMEAASHVSWLFYDVASKIQLRLQGRAEVIKGSIADAAWNNTPLQSRSSYLSVTSPGERVAEQQPPDLTDRDTTLSESERGRQYFRVVRTTVQSLDWLYLREMGHVRAAIAYGQSGECSASWLVP